MSKTQKWIGNMENNRKLSASAIVVRDGKVLMVRHTYGAAKGKLLIPGGFCEEGEMPQTAAEREVREEAGVTVRAGDLAAVRFTTQEVWCIFLAEYVKGEPRSDQRENSEALFLPVEELLSSEEVVETTKELVKAALREGKPTLAKSSFVNASFTPDAWQLFI